MEVWLAYKLHNIHQVPMVVILTSRDGGPLSHQDEALDWDCCFKQHLRHNWTSPQPLIKENYLTSSSTVDEFPSCMKFFLCWKHGLPPSCSGLEMVIVFNHLMERITIQVTTYPSGCTSKVIDEMRPWGRRFHMVSCQK